MRQATLEDYQTRVLRVLAHIQEHLDESLSLEELARIAHFSPCHFHRIFSGMVGEGLREHIRRLRLERAAAQLIESDHGITRIAFEAGFETHESFTRAFRAMFGLTPSAHRSRRRPARLRGPSATGVHWIGDTEPLEFQPNSLRGATMNVTVEKLEPRRVAFVRHTGPYGSAGIRDAWAKLCGWAAPKGLLNAQTLCLGLGHDDPAATPPDQIRYDACITVPDGIEGEGDIGMQEIGGGEYAKATHVGPYERLAETYAAVCGQWGAASGRDFCSSPCIEIYRNFPGSTPPEQLITDVYVPLECSAICGRSEGA